MYFASLKAYCAANVEKGCMFEVPITVVVPVVELHHGYQYSWSVDTGLNLHTFVYFVRIVYYCRYFIIFFFLNMCLSLLFLFLSNQ